MNEQMQYDSAGEHRQPVGLERAQFLELCVRSLSEWDRGSDMPSLAEIRERGSEVQYADAVSRLCRHDDKGRDREVERQAQRLRAPRAD